MAGLRTGSTWISASILGALLISCASAPDRNSEEDRRRLLSVGQNQPTARESIDQDASAFQIRRWLRDLDSPDDRIFSRASQGIRDNLSRLPAVLESPRGAELPSTIRGKRALIELLASTADRSVAPESFWRNLTLMVASYARLVPSGDAGEEPDALELRLAALTAIRTVAPDVAAQVMRERLFDPTREVRWAAAAYFREHVGELTLTELQSLVQELRSPNAESRADALLLLVYLDQEFQRNEGRANPTGISYDPYAPELIRNNQVSAWESWLSTAEARLANLRSRSERVAPGD